MYLDKFSRTRYILPWCHVHASMTVWFLLPPLLLLLAMVFCFQFCYFRHKWNILQFLEYMNFSVCNSSHIQFHISSI